MSDNVQPLLVLAICFYIAIGVGLLVDAFARRRATFFDPLVQCVVFISLFTLPLPLRALYSDVVEGDVTEHLPQLKPFLPAAVFYTAVALVVFAIAYYSAAARAFGRALPRPPRPKSLGGAYVAAAAVGCIAFALVVMLARSTGGLLGFILLGYGSSAETFGRGYLAVGFPWLFVASLMPLYRFAYQPRAIDRIVAIVWIGVLVAVQLILGNRSAVMYMAIVIVVFWHFAIRRFSGMLLATLGFVGFVALNIAGSLRGSDYSSLKEFVDRTTSAATHTVTGGTLHEGMFYTLTTGEFVVPFETFPEMIRSVGTRVEARFGATMVRAPVFAIPSAIYSERPLPLTSWYVRSFYGSGFGLNEGRSFFFLAEGYLNFGLAGVLMVGLLWGWFWGGVREYLRLSRGEPGAVLLVALTIAFVFRAVAGDAVSLVVGLPEQSLSAAVAALAVATRFRSWYVRRSGLAREISA